MKGDYAFVTLTGSLLWTPCDAAMQAHRSDCNADWRFHSCTRFLEHKMIRFSKFCESRKLEAIGSNWKHKMILLMKSQTASVLVCPKLFNLIFLLVFWDVALVIAQDFARASETEERSATGIYYKGRKGWPRGVATPQRSCDTNSSLQSLDLIQFNSLVLFSIIVISRYISLYLVISRDILLYLVISRYISLCFKPAFVMLKFALCTSKYWMFLAR